MKKIIISAGVVIILLVTIIVHLSIENRELKEEIGVHYLYVVNHTAIKTELYENIEKNDFAVLLESHKRTLHTLENTFRFFPDNIKLYAYQFFLDQNLDIDNYLDNPDSSDLENIISRGKIFHQSLLNIKEQLGENPITWYKEIHLIVPAK
jgi:hypothetical protein